MTIPASGRPTGRCAGRRRPRAPNRQLWLGPALVLGAVLGGLPLGSAAWAAKFDCGLSAERVTALTDDIRKDATDYEVVQRELAAGAGRTFATQDDPRTAAKRQAAAYVRKTMPAKVAALRKELDQALARGCLNDDEVAEAVARGAAFAEKVLAPPT